MSGYRFLLRRGTAAQWQTADPVLLDGEPGLERDTGRMKLGDGSTTWTDLPYVDTAGLAEKADAADVAASLATKANASTVGALTTRVDTTETRVGDVEDELPLKLDVTAANATIGLRVGSTVGGAAVAAIGNSIEEGGTVNATQVLGSKSWANALCLRSGGRLRLVRNAGISGETMGQMLARFDTDVTPYAPSVVLLGSGENDLKPEFGLTVAQCVDRAAALVEKTRSIGALPVLHTCVPRPAATVTLARLVEFNDRLVRYAQANGIPIVDFYSFLVSETDGSLYANATYHSDGTHPTTAGAAAIADFALGKILDYLPPGDVFLARSNNDPLNLFTNALFLTDTNGDGVADGWTKSGSEVTASLVTVAGVPGKMAQLERTTTGAVRATLLQSVTATGKFAPGNRMAVAHRIQAEGDAAAYNGLYGIFTGGTGSFKSWDLGRGPIPNGVGYYEFTVPAGTTSIDFYVASDPGIGKLRVGQMTLRNLTALGIA